MSLIMLSQVPIADIEKAAEDIAESQLTFEILFILLTSAIVFYFAKTSRERERKLMEFHEKSKLEALRREERLLENLDRNTKQSEKISNTIAGIQQEMSRLNTRLDNIERNACFAKNKRK